MNTPVTHEQPFIRPSAGTLLRRAVWLRCPRCGVGPLFTRWLSMPKACEQCQFRYERQPGYFLGSSYINYGITALSMTLMYVIGHFGCGLAANLLVLPLALFTMVVPLLLFRHARACWLAFDCYFDSSVLVDED